MSTRYAMGDRLILRRTGGMRGPDSEVVVYKTGRKWGYAKPEGKSYPDVKFDLETGYEDGRGFASHQRVLTAEQDADEKRILEATGRLKALGVRVDYYARREFSADALERVADILAADGGAA
jgi:hypothetical protein